MNAGLLGTLIAWQRRAVRFFEFSRDERRPALEYCPGRASLTTIRPNTGREQRSVVGGVPNWLVSRPVADLIVGRVPGLGRDHAHRGPDWGALTHWPSTISNKTAAFRNTLVEDGKHDARSVAQRSRQRRAGIQTPQAQRPFPIASLSRNRRLAEAALLRSNERHTFEGAPIRASARIWAAMVQRQ